jgi:hypothetical protein
MVDEWIVVWFGCCCDGDGLLEMVVRLCFGRGAAGLGVAMVDGD